MKRNNLLLLWFTMVLCSCSRMNPPEVISFYYWKTNYHLNNYESEYLRKHQVKKIYLRCFDIVLENKVPKPEGVLLWHDDPLNEVEYIPTVTITNNVFTHSDTSYLINLANKTYALCSQIMSAKHLPLREIQFDCDWTETTREAYFYFLSYMKKKKINISNTLRLYQYKYREEAGIAPTDYASLMCYNMGNLKNAQTENSILNLSNLTSYLSHSSYPKPINIALPIFNWTLVYQGQTFKGILYDHPDLGHGNWEKSTTTTYFCKQDYYDLYCKQEFFKGEMIRIEEISHDDLRKANTLIHSKLNNTKHEIIYFDLDSAKLSHCLP